MTARPRIDDAERRRRIATRHHVAPGCRAKDLERIADDVVGIHATDPASVYLGFLARSPDVTPASLAETLYERRALLRVLGMRRTMFVTSVETAGLVTSAVTTAIAHRERKRLVTWLKESGAVQGNVESWVSDVESETVAALDEMGSATAVELTKRVPGLRVQIPFGEGRTWAGQVGVSTRMLFLLATEARIIRGKPRGTWLSSMYAWAPMDQWVPGGLPTMPVAQAQAELVRRWLRSFGPGTLRDMKWWTGWTVRDTRAALAAAGAIEVDLESGAGWALPDDLTATADPGPWVALLPALDTTTMGWAERYWYLGTHGARLFDTNGNAGPTIWVDGRVVGGWAQGRDGEVRFGLLEDVGQDARRAIEAEAARIREWLAESRVIPRFRTPVEMDLVA